jgi:hypothetical protein
MSTNFPTSFDIYSTLLDNIHDVLAEHPNDRGDAIEAIEAKLGVDSSAVATSIDYLLKSASSTDPGHKHQLLVDFFVSATTKLYFYANTAPTTWTIVAVTDAVLAVKGGSNAYNVTGGQTAGTWTWPSTTLDATMIPAHTHQLGSRDSTAGDSSSTGGREFIQDYGYAGTGFGVPSWTSYYGGDTPAHSHGSNTFRPLAAVGIIAVKS